MVEESKRLGRGLAALLGEGSVFSSEPPSNLSVRKAPIEMLRPNPRNPRKNFAESTLDELAQSIRERGILQPILVRQTDPAGGFEIIAGERRWRAAQLAGMHETPIICIEADDSAALEIAIIENVQRSDLNPLEEAEGYLRLLDEFRYSRQSLASAIGKSRSHVSNTIRLLKLPQKTRDLLAKGDITAGHARALLGVDNADEVAEKIVERNLSVRDVEALAASDRESAPPQASKRPDPHVAELEKRLADSLGMKVSLTCRGESGDLHIRFSTLEQLDLLSAKLGV